MGSAFYPNPPLEAVPRQMMKNGGAFNQGSYSSGAPWSVKIDRVGALMGVILAVVGTNASGATPGTPTARVRNPGQILGSTVKLTVNGKEEFSAHPDLLLLRAQWRRGRIAELQRDSLTTSELTAANTTSTFSMQLPFDFVPGEALVPYHPGVLFSGDASDIELSGTWGTISDLMISPGATEAVSAVALALFKDMTRLRVGGPDGRDGLTPQQAAVGFGHFRLNQPGGADVTSTGTASWVKDIPGGRAYCALYFRAIAGSTTDASDAPYLTSGGFLRIKRGSDVIFEKSLAELINDTAQGLPYGMTRTGWLVVDILKAFRPDAQAILSRMLLSPTGQPLTIEIDATTSTGAHIDVMTEEFIDPVSSASQRYSR